MRYTDEAYIIGIRRKLHQYPEVGYDLYQTCAIVKGELDALALPYEEHYAPQSIVCDINPDRTNRTVAIRADMDALPITENTGLPFASRHPGRMHACGHDAHTACVLGAAKALFTMREKLNGRVRFIFQPNEEGAESTPPGMIEKGVLNGVDEIIGLHVDNEIDCGKLGFCKGAFLASCRNFVIEVFGKSAHATRPELGIDALACAVGIYETIRRSAARAVPEAVKYICEINSLTAGNAHNVIPDYAKMLGTVRTHDLAVDAALFDLIRETAERTAEECGCTVKITSTDVLPPLYNDPDLTARVMESARKAIGETRVTEIGRKMISEDFADFTQIIPAVDLMVGTGNPQAETRTGYHESNFVIEEAALKYAADALVGYVLDRLHP